MKFLIAGMILATSSLSVAYDPQPKPTVEGNYSDAGNCETPRSDGWAYCWLWNDLNLDWEQRLVHCPTVGCDRKFPPLE